MSNSSFSPQSWKYDVFLSFRGEDTRNTFVAQLYTALVQQNNFTYKDDKTLPRGETIAPALLEAIEGSGISVIVFSENYANSSWCLDELAHIMKCMDELGTTVMPVFYLIDPSNVRKQKGKYGEALAKHELENNKKVESWRKALVGASNISGWEIKLGNEAKDIEEIVNAIKNRLFPLMPNVNERLIGIESRFQDMKSLLELNSPDVLMVGLWGVGGGGKTTLAKYVYNEISSNFVGCYFVENIRNESIKYGLEKLQAEIMRKVLKKPHMEVPDNVVEGREMIKRELWDKKVLIVLDDVSHLDHLQALAGSHDWFGDGSRIIVTTRDIDLLNDHKLDVIHKIRLLDHEEDIKLFRKHAPQNNRPREDYELLSKQVVSYAGGLPLALIVLGSFLCDKVDMDEWRSALARLQDIPETDIVEKLKISFDGLKPIEQELFLDIACFYRGEKKKDAMESLDACGFHSRIGINVLMHKALITINSDRKFDMHDLIQEMGHYIVTGEHPRNPEKHSRVWQVDDVTNICSVDDATMEFDKIEAIQIYSDMNDPLPHHNRHVVANMKKLRFIDWTGHHASSLPTNLPQRELRCLILSKGQHKQLWNGNKYLPNLKMIKLHVLENLTMTPDFSGLPNLERFMINRSPCLEEIHESIGGLENLVFLLITGCNNLKKFPSIGGIKKLETLSFSKCNKLLSKSEKEVASYKQHSTTNDCVTRLLSTLKEPFSFLKGMNRTWSFEYISKGLKRLNLSYCRLGDEDIDSNVWELPNLQELDLSYNVFTRLSSRVLLLLPQLKWLDISFCNRLVELTELPSSIAVLRADYCYELDYLGDLSNYKWLWKVSFLGKNKLRPCNDEILLDEMSQGYAIEHHFMSLALEHQARKLYESSAVGQQTFILALPHNWCNDFSGFLVHCVIEYQEPFLTIIIKQKQQEEIECHHKNELFSNPPPPPTYIGYFSFSELKRHATWLNSACNMISFTLRGKFSVKLVPRKSGGGNSVPKSDRLHFWDEEREDKTFTIQRESKSAINILWSPCSLTQ